MVAMAGQEGGEKGILGEDRVEEGDMVVLLFFYEMQSCTRAKAEHA
jgi:hypothetical protein